MDKVPKKLGARRFYDAIKNKDTVFVQLYIAAPEGSVQYVVNDKVFEAWKDSEHDLEMLSVLLLNTLPCKKYYRNEAFVNQVANLLYSRLRDMSKEATEDSVNVVFAINIVHSLVAAGYQNWYRIGSMLAYKLKEDATWVYLVAAESAVLAACLFSIQEKLDQTISWFIERFGLLTVANIKDNQQVAGALFENGEYQHLQTLVPDKAAIKSLIKDHWSAHNEFEKIKAGYDSYLKLIEVFPWIKEEHEQLVAATRDDS